MDAMVRCYINRMREKGGIINTSIVKAAARGILLSQERSRLAEFGGPATLNNSMGKIFIKEDELYKKTRNDKSKAVS